MGEGTKLILMLAAALLGSSVLTAAVTLYFTRRKTAAEARNIDADAAAKQSVAHKTDADATHVEAESVQLYVGELRASIQSWKAAMADWAECVKEKSAAEARAAAAEARWREESTERERIEKYAEGLRLQKVAADVEITRLNGELAEVRRG